jgi:hypothetical protein
MTHTLTIDQINDIRALITEFKNGEMSAHRFRAFIIGLYNPHSRFTFEYNAFNEHLDRLLQLHFRGASEILDLDSSGGLFYFLTDSDN